jgi:hypothetical protein
MNNTINRIKVFFKGKPARIIIALLVIAAIMTGVAFGVIALVNAISDPCAQQQGKEWNKELKKCVLRECPDGGKLCLIKGASKEGNCVPKDYCKDYGGDKYRFDQNTCECTIDCSNHEEMPFTKHGKSFTKFTEDGVPADPLTCGKPCEYNTIISNGLPGGYKWCPSEGYLCGQLIYKENDNAAPGEGCWEKSRFHDCSEDIVCPEGVACVSNKEGQPRCMPSLCSGEENNKELVYACLNDNDCINPYKSDTSINDAKCITGELASNDEDKKFTHFKEVGYCSKTNRFKDHYCTIKRLIGETSASISDDSPVIKICENINSSVEGISTFNPQCDGIAENGCAKCGICPNEWQGKSEKSDNDPHCIDPKESIEEARNEMEYHCCDNPAVTPAGNKFCCPHKTFSDPEFGDQLCTLNTKFGYSKKHLDNTASLSETLSCSVDEDCTKHNKDFYKVLGITQSEAEDKTNNNFSSLYCDKKDNVCKAFCGFYDATTQLEDNLGKIDISISSSSEEEQYSFCFPKDSCEIAWQKVKDGLYLPNGYPVCEKTEGQTSTYKWSGNYGDGYTFKSESSLMGDCSDKASINTCMNALGKSNYHINDVYVIPPSGKDKGKCGFSAACDQLELTTDKGTVSWTSLKEPSWANLNKIEFTGTPKTETEPEPAQQGIGKIAQTANPKNKTTGIQKYATASKGKCIGQTNSFDEDITVNPFNYVPDVNSCNLNESNISKLRYNGEYCKLFGVDPLSPTGACLDKSLDCTKENPKENFGNVDITKNNKKTNTLSSAQSPHALPKNQVFGLVYNKTTDEKKKNMQATIQDSYSNSYSCADMLLSHNDAKEKNLNTEQPGITVNIKCEDDECGHGNIKCFDTDGQPTACCGSYDATNPYIINYDSQTEIYSCVGGKGFGYKLQGYPDYNCILVQDGWKYNNTEAGKQQCLEDLQGGGYYCNGFGTPGRIIDPANNMNKMSNTSGIQGDSGMKGTTGCKWTANAYFDDDIKPEWSQDNLTIQQCTVMCSQKLEGNRISTLNSAKTGYGLDFSQQQTQKIEGKVCGWAPYNNHEVKQEDIWPTSATPLPPSEDLPFGQGDGIWPKNDVVGTCSIRDSPQVVGNGTESDWWHGLYLTTCNDVFPNPISRNTKELGDTCALETCRGKATGCFPMCYEWDFIGNDCNRPVNNMCCGTNRGDYDGVTGCGYDQRPKCLDNNNYPCISLYGFVEAANTALQVPSNFTGPTQHRSTC